MNSHNDFASLGLAEPLLRAISASGYTTPTPVQSQAIPLVLAGRDLRAAAQTGTGKTAGFTLPLLQRLAEGGRGRTDKGPRCLIVTPTRELAAQIHDSVRTYGKYLTLKSAVIFGGVNIRPQVEALRRGLDILVATPGRLLDHVSQRNVDFSGVEIVVLDEADRMLDMGFIRDVRRILSLLPKQRQSLLFSATFSDPIRRLADELLHDPAMVEVARRNTTAELVTQYACHVDQKAKRQALVALLREQGWDRTLVFTRTKHGANRLAEQLNREQLGASAIHGNKSQAARTKALAGFKDGSVSILVATDIAARGLDIDGLPGVVNYDLPNVPEDYVHRIGRTGRAGETGIAISLVSPDQRSDLRGIEKLIGRPLEVLRVSGHDALDASEAALGPGAGEHSPRNGGGPRPAPGGARRRRRTPRRSKGHHQGGSPRS